MLHKLQYYDDKKGAKVSRSTSSSFGVSKLPSGRLNDRRIAQKIYSGDYRIAVYGLGHVGSAMASVWLRAGAYVIGIDRSPTVLNHARMGRTHLPEPGVNEAYRDGIASGRFSIYENLECASRDSYLKMICVPVLSRNGSADLSTL